jgi:hypothetical protein
MFQPRLQNNQSVQHRHDRAPGVTHLARKYINHFNGLFGNEAADYHSIEAWKN